MEATGVRELRRRNTDWLRALVVGVEGDAGDFEVLRRIELGAVQIRPHLKNLDLERGFSLRCVHGRGQDGAVAAAEGNAAAIGVVEHGDRKIEDGGRALTVKNLGKV